MSDDSGVKTFEQWVALENPESWLVASARSAHRIPQGREMTREDFHAFLEKTKHAQMLPAPLSAEQKAASRTTREGPQAPTPDEIPDP